MHIYKCVSIYTHIYNVVVKKCSGKAQPVKIIPRKYLPSYCTLEYFRVPWAARKKEIN